jgi:hypothetical protein
MSMSSAEAVEVLVERLRKHGRDVAAALDLERARSRRLYNENVELGKRILRLEAENRRLVQDLDAALLPRSM